MAQKTNKKFKGFTLVELIGVIALLAVVMLIAFISISKIKQNVLEKQKENLITTIIVSARKYHDETGSTKVPVEILIQGGYIQGEETKDGIISIIDPLNNKSLNCSYVDFTETENGKFVESDTCEDAIITEAASNIQYCISTSDDCSSWIDMSKVSDWIAINTNERFYLRTTLNGTDYNWITTLAPDKQGRNRVYEIVIPEDKVINGTYNVSFNYNDLEYYSTVDVKLDARKPLISNVNISDAGAWAVKKYLTAELQDSESGLKSYAIMTNTSVPTDTDWNEISGNTYTINEELVSNGNYYIWVRDNSLQVSNSSVIKVDKIDNTAPKMTVSVTNGEKYSKSKEAIVTITDEGNDGEIVGFTNNSVYVKYVWSTSSVNCNTMTSYDTAELTLQNKYEYKGKITISGKTGAGKLYVCPYNSISDDLGNILLNNVVSKAMYLDNMGPDATFFVSRNSNYEYNSIKASYTIKSIQDNHSGLGEMCITESANSSSCDNSLWVNAANATNVSYTFNASDGSGDTVTLYLHIKDVLGNITTKQANYTIYKYCTEKSVISDTGYGLCSEKCGNTGIKTKTIYYGDKYLTNYTDCGDETETESCTATTHDSNCGTWQWSTCTGPASCGNGTKYEYRTCTKISDEDNSTNCGTVTRKQNEGTTCSLGACDEPINDYRYDGCDTYYITTCTSTTCTYTIKNASATTGTIARSSLSASPNCSSGQSYCYAWLNSRNGTTVKYSVTGDKTDCKIKDGESGCTWGTIYKDSNKFTVTINKSSCRVRVNLSGVGYVYRGTTYDYISWTAVKCGSNVCTDSCNSGVCA